MFNEIDEGLWHDTHDLTLPGGVQFKTRSTLVRLQDGGLWMHSPIPIDDARADAIAGLGEVRHLVAPNGFHDSFSGAAKSRYPDATLWASPALRRPKSLVPADAWLDEAPPPWAEELRPHAIAGAPKGGEYVFLHAKSKSLIVTDLMFQIRYPVNLRTKAVLWMAGAHGGRLAQSRLWRTLVKDRAAAAHSIESMLEWDFERVILGHGDFVEGSDARQRTRDALSWMLAGG